jgi:hypothetical protein
MILCVLIAACSKSEPGVLMQPEGALTVTERVQLAEIHPLLTNWMPSFSAVWIRSGATQHVYLYEHGVGSLTVSAKVFAFDSDGKLIDASILSHRNDKPGSCTLLSLSPLRIRYSYNSGNPEEVSGKYQKDLAIQKFRREMLELEARIQTKSGQ